MTKEKDFQSTFLNLTILFEDSLRLGVFCKSCKGYYYVNYHRQRGT